MSFVGKKALTFGSATIDVIASVDDHDIERMTMNNAASSFLLLEEGRKIDVASVNSSVGGGATNTAVSIARLGYDAACVVRIGEDNEGDTVLETLRAENIDTRLVIRDPSLPTGKTIMVSSHVRNPTIFTSRGSNVALTDAEVTESLFAGRDLVYVAGLSGDSAACFPRIVKLAKQAGAFVAVNPGIRQLTYWAGDVREALAHVDLLSINAVEAEQLALTLIPKGQPKRGKQQPPADGPQLMRTGLAGRSLEKLVQRVCEEGPKIILITNGSEGAYAGTRDGITFFPADRIKVGSTAGAGDAFASTFAAFAASGADMETSLRAATRNAASVIRVSDTHSGLMGYDDLIAAMEK